MTFKRFSELFTQMLSEVSGYNISLNDKIGEACDELDLVEAECRFDKEYGVILHTDDIVYSGKVSTVLSKIYDDNNYELVNLIE